MTCARASATATRARVRVGAPVSLRTRGWGAWTGVGAAGVQVSCLHYVQPKVPPSLVIYGLNRSSSRRPRGAHRHRYGRARSCGLTRL